MLRKLFGLTKKRLPLFLLIGLFIFIFSVRQANAFILYDEPPPTIAVWEISPVYNNSIGSVIVATLRLTHARGTTIDYLRMPDEGDVWDLRDKPAPVLPVPDNYVPQFPAPHNDYHGEHYDPPTIEEGQVEVRSRTITSYNKGDQIVTEIRLELQYLDPIDFTGLDDKQLTSYVTVFQVYWRYTDKLGLDWYRGVFAFKPGIFYIAQRVDENSRPILQLHTLESPSLIWPYVRVAGFGFLILAFSLLVRQGIGIARNLAKTVEPSQSELTAEVPPTLSELYSLWQGGHDYRYFIQAVISFRERNRTSRSSELWEETTNILYSGNVFDESNIRRIFEKMIKEDDHGTSI